MLIIPPLLQRQQQEHYPTGKTALRGGPRALMRGMCLVRRCRNGKKRRGHRQGGRKFQICYRRRRQTSPPDNHCGKTKTLCIWKMDLCQVARMWEVLTKVLGDEVSVISKVFRSMQKDGRVRFDLRIKEREDVIRTLISLRKATTELGWYVREDVSWEERNRRRDMNSWRKVGKGFHDLYHHIRSSSSSSSHHFQPHWREYNHEDNEGLGIRMVSWNIASVNGKREELADRMVRCRIDIMALQETRRATKDWPLRIPGYHCIESLVSECQASNGLAQANGEEPGRNGLALFVSEDIQAHVVGNDSGYFIFVRLSGGPIATPCVVGNIYRPLNSVASRKMMDELKTQVHALRNRFQDDPIIIMGDWNLRTDEMGMIRKWEPQLDCLKVRGGARTFHSRGRRGDIDHIVIDQGHSHLLKDARVLRKWDLSDHWPIMTRMLAIPYVRDVPVLKRKMTGSVMPKLVGAYPFKEWPRIMGQYLFVNQHNRWSPLADMLDEDGDLTVIVEKASQDFVEASFEIAEEAKWTSASGGEKVRRGGLLTRGHRKRIEERLGLYERFQSLPEGLDRDIAEAKYLDFRTELKDSIQKYQHKKLLERSVKAACNASVDPKQTWNFLADLGQWKDMKSATGPSIIKDENGRLLTDKQEVGEAWVRHYSRLAEDASGHGQDASFWKDKVTDWGLPHLEELNVDFTLQELYDGTRKMKR